MKKILNKVKEATLWLWQVPQHLLALVLRMFYDGDDLINEGLVVKTNAKIRVSKKMKGGISLGNYIILKDKFSNLTLRHELGHSKQSLILGPLYLIVIGLPSLLHASMYNGECGTPNRYYKFYTEKWADKLAGIKRA